MKKFLDNAIELFGSNCIDGFDKAHPFINKGKLWDTIPLLFWTILQFPYIIPWLLFELITGIIAFALFLIRIFAVPIAETIIISARYPDGSAIDKIKKIWSEPFEIVEENNKNGEPPVTPYSPWTNDPITPQNNKEEINKEEINREGKIYNTYHEFMSDKNKGISETDTKQLHNW